MPRVRTFSRPPAPATPLAGTPATLPALWHQAYRGSYPPHFFLYADKSPEPRFERYPELFTPEDKMDRVSFKQLNASAHCLGAYMLSRGLRKGDVVLVLSENRPVYAVFELGIQLVGGVNLTLPLEASPAMVQEAIERFKPKFICLSSYLFYEQHRPLMEAFSERGEVLVRSLYHDELRFTDRLVTLEALEDQGKDYWRMNRVLVSEHLQNIRPSDISTLLLHTPEKLEPQRLTHADVLEMARRGAKVLSPAQGRFVAVLNTAPTWTLLHRVAALYAPLLLNLPVVYAADLSQLPTATPADYQLAGVATPEALHIQENRIQAMVRQRSATRHRRLNEALDLAAEKEELAARKQKLPFLKNRRLASRRNSLLRPLRKSHFARIERLLTHPLGRLSAQERRFYSALELSPAELLSNSVEF